MDDSSYLGDRCGVHRGGTCGACGALPRRRLLQGLGALAVGNTALFASGCATTDSGKPTVIDTHHHYYPPAYQKAWLDWEDKRNIPHFSSQVAWSIQGALRDMDAAGVQRSVLSIASTPGVWFDLPVPEVARMARLCNDYAADMVRSYPGRFGQFATLPMIDVDSTLKEIDHVFDVLKVDGVGLQTNYGDKWPGDAAYRPIFDELNRRKAIVYFHPLVANCCSRLSVGTFPAVIEVPHDTTRAAVSLLLSGTLARQRDIRWLLSHAGGTLPMMAGRVDFFHGEARNREQFAPNGIEAEFKRLYYDTANATNAPAMAPLMKLADPTRVVYGSDYPYVPMKPQITALGTLGLGDSLVRAILTGNAEQLLASARPR